MKDNDAAALARASPCTVPFLDIKAQARAIWQSGHAVLESLIENAEFILGPAVERFEHDFADYLGVRHCVGVNNGTSALHLSLLAAGVGPGDEVISTPHSWISSSWAINYVGARPIYVDIDPLTYNLNPALVAPAITRKTRAILPVHLYGQSADLAPLLELAQAHGITVIEDAAQAHGCVYHGRKVGSWGKAGCFSFYPGKNLGAFGEAGAVVTNDDALAERIRRLRDHAQHGRHCHVEIGYNMRMEGIQAAVLALKLGHLDAWNAARRRHARRYHELLADVPGVILPAMPRVDEEHVWHLFVIRVADRDRLRADLAQRDIASAIHYPTPIPLQPAFAYLGHRPGEFPVAEQIMSTCLSLPMFAEMTDDQIAWTARCIKDLCS